jgi:hypothetical protein
MSQPPFRICLDNVTTLNGLVLRQRLNAVAHNLLFYRAETLSNREERKEREVFKGFLGVFSELCGSINAF